MDKRWQIRPDVLGSLGLHIGLVCILSFWTPVMSDRVLTDNALPIEMISIDEFTQLLEKPKPPEQVATEPPSSPREQTAAPEQAPPPAPQSMPEEAMPELTKSLPREAAQKPKTIPPPAPSFQVAKSVPMARPSLPKPKPKPLLDIGQVRALLDKTPDAAPAERVDAAIRRETPSAPKLTLNEIDAFRAQMRRCWSPPSGARQAENLMVNVRLSLSPSGAILAGPVVVNRGQLGDPFFRAAAESVLRAIRRCQPFSLPVEKYASWRDIELKFDPSKMLGN